MNDVGASVCCDAKVESRHTRCVYLCDIMHSLVTRQLQDAQPG